MRAIVLGTVAFLTAGLLTGPILASVSCSSDRSLHDLADEAKLIVFGNLSRVTQDGFELADGTVSHAPMTLGVSYKGQLFRLKIRVHRVLKGSGGEQVEAYGSLPILTLGSCPSRKFQRGKNAVFLLAERPSGYWVLEGWEGVLYTEEQGVAGIEMQFHTPVQVE